MNPAVIAFIVIAAGIVLYFATAIKIVRQYEKGLVERLGKYQRTVDPGMNLIIPFIETVPVPPIDV